MDSSDVAATVDAEEGNAAPATAVEVPFEKAIVNATQDDAKVVAEEEV